MDEHLFSLVANLVTLVVISIRIQLDGMYESGTFLRIGLFMTVCWFLLGDVDYYVGSWDWLDIAQFGSPARAGVAQVVAIVSILIDMYRFRQRRQSNLKMNKLEGKVESKIESKVESK